MSDSDGIAIIGMGCRVPGADNVHEFWDLLVRGECMLREVPASRWDASAYLDPDRNSGSIGTAYVQKGAFLSDIDGFDNEFFNIKQFEASQMDPQQRVLLECTFMAMQDAGITRQEVSGSNTGVFIGSMNNDHGTSYIGCSSKVSSVTVTGSATALIANRISYVFNLLGPSMEIDTACSSSLIALHLACQSVRSGLSQAFSDKADGYARGEGCGVVIIKRLKKALEDGNNILATVAGTGTNQDGRTATTEDGHTAPVSAPSSSQQKKLLETVYSKAGVDVSELHYIEAHGTGTPVGDPVEVNALGEFFRQKGERRNRYIGSLKSVIGHTESAAGVLSVIKLVLMMKHNKIVPSLHCDTVNPKIDFDALAFIIPKELIPWSSPKKLACCSGFGVGGSNCHAVLQSYPMSSRKTALKRKTTIVCFSGNSEKSLKGSLKDTVDNEAQSVDVSDLSFTSTVHREHFRYRAAFAVDDMQELSKEVEIKLNKNAFFPCKANPSVVFVFSGMGTAWFGMCMELMQEYAVFRDKLLEVDKELKKYVHWSLSEQLQQEAGFKNPVFVPVAIFACQVALVALWESFGVRACCVLGQSVGEVAAAYTAGCLTLADAVRIMYHRSKALAQVTGGGMILVRSANVDAVQKALKEMTTDATISQEYSPAACAISARARDIPEWKTRLEETLKHDFPSVLLQDLDVSVAYHSPHVSLCVEQLAESLTGMSASPASIPLVSTVTGRVLEGAPGVDHWLDNVQRPVLFKKAVVEAKNLALKPSSGNLPSNASGPGSLVFLEIGPTAVLKAHIKDIFPDRNYPAVPSMARGKEVKCLLQAVGTLYEHGVDVPWEHLAAASAGVTAFPRYSFDKKVLRDTSEMDIILRHGEDIGRKAHLFTCPIRGKSSVFDILISPLTAGSVYDHVIATQVVVPGALYAEAAFAVAEYRGLKKPVAIHADFEHAATMMKNEVFAASIHVHDATETTEHWSHLLTIHRDGRRLAGIKMLEAVPNKAESVSIDTIKRQCTEELGKDEIYSLLRQFGFAYGPSFQLLENASRNASECLAAIKLTDTVLGEKAGMTIHPSVLDCMLQSCVVLLSQESGSVTNVLPISLGRLVIYGPVDPVMIVHTRRKQTDSLDAFVFDLRLLNESGQVVGELDEFVVQSLASEGTPTLTEMLTLKWHRIPFDKTKEKYDRAAQKMILVTDIDLKLEPSQKVLQYNWQKNESLNTEKLKHWVETNPGISAVILLYSGEVDDYMSGQTVHSCVLNLCCTIQNILKVLSEQRVPPSFCLCTFNAWPSLGYERLFVNVNPVATALWGLLRTFVIENRALRAVSLEVHGAQGSETLSTDTIHAVCALLTDLEDLRGSSEVLLNEEGAFVNHVVNVAHPPKIPARRLGLPGKMADIPEGSVVLSEDPGMLTNAVAVHCPSPVTPKGNEQSLKTIRPTAFAQPPEELLELTVPSECLLPERQSSHKMYLSMAIEVEGIDKDKSTSKLAVCFPVPVSREVTVPACVTIPKALIPEYIVGDITKLVLLRSLLKKLPSGNVTILATAETERLSEVLKLMCQDKPSVWPKAEIVCVEKLDRESRLNEILLSLVSLDQRLLSSLMDQWEQAVCLVTLRSLVCSELISSLAFCKPAAQVCLVDTQLLYHPSKLQRNVPAIKRWLQHHVRDLKTVFEALHSDQQQTQSGVWRVMRFKTISIEMSGIKGEHQSLFRRDGAYIVVGGLTGLGWLCVEFLAQHGAGYVAIFNRRAATAQQLEQMESWQREFGCQVVAYQVDVTSVESLNRALNALKFSGQKVILRGVFFGAAVEKDGEFLKMDRSSIDAVLAPKVQGSWNLHKLTRRMALDYFVLHSSVASFLGNRGQANYSAGNAFKDGLAVYRRQQNLEAQAINWGPLEIGLLENNETAKQYLKRSGFDLASSAEVRKSLNILLHHNWTQSVPVRLDFDKYAERVLAGSLVRLQSHFNHAESKGAVNKPFEAELQKIQSMNREERMQTFEKYVQQLASGLLGVDVSHVSREANLPELGLDSPSATEMISYIHRDTALRLQPVQLVTGDVTVVSVAVALSELAEKEFAGQ